jgi:hypothetical protein
MLNTCPLLFGEVERTKSTGASWKQLDVTTSVFRKWVARVESLCKNGSLEWRLFVKTPNHVIKASYKRVVGLVDAGVDVAERGPKRAPRDLGRSEVGEDVRDL